MINIRLARNYHSPDLKRQSPANDGIWNDICITEDGINDPDFCVILNYPEKDVRIKVNKGGTWLFLQEPPDHKNVFYKNYFKFADRVYSGFGDEIENGVNEIISLPWHINKSYTELINLKHTDCNKTKNVSWITSNNRMFAGHDLRLDFMDFLKTKKFNFDLFGRGFNPISDKFDGLANYKYSIAIENYSGENYWTEKIQDCFLSWCMPIYYGCKNMDKYFPKESYIHINPNEKHNALEIIEDAIRNELWLKNIEAIAEARNLILNKYQLFPQIEAMVHEYYRKNPSPKKVKKLILASGLSRRNLVITKLKNWIR